MVELKESLEVQRLVRERQWEREGGWGETSGRNVSPRASFSLDR